MKKMINETQIRINHIKQHKKEFIGDNIRFCMYLKLFLESFHLDQNFIFYIKEQIKSAENYNRLNFMMLCDNKLIDYI